MKRQRGTRCAGFLSSDERYAFCQREEYAGALPLRQSTQPPTYMHKLDGPCNCGEDHGSAYRLVSLPRHETMSELNTSPKRSHLSHTPTAIYDYGAGLRFLRFGQGEGKTFVWQHSDGQGGWLDGREGQHPGLYQAEKIAAADAHKLVFWPEGEKCVDALRAVGALATCNPDGALRFAPVKEEAREALSGRHVVILSDTDKCGREHAGQIAAGLQDAAASVRVIELEDAHDVADWLSDGHELVELLELVAVTPVKSNIDSTKASAAYADLKASYDTLVAQNWSMNEKLLWIFDTIATSEEIMPISKRITLILARRNAEWRVLDPETPEERHQIDKGYTPDFYEALGNAGGMSEGTAGKNLRSLQDDYGLLHIDPFREIKDGEGRPRISYSIEPTAISNHKAWMPKDGPRAKRGGAGRGQGRKSIRCPNPKCGGEAVSTKRQYRELVERVVAQYTCPDCGEIVSIPISEHVIGHEPVTSGAPYAAPAESVKSMIDFTIPATPDEGDDSAARDSNDTPPPPYPYTATIDFTPECHATDVAPQVSQYSARDEVLTLAASLDWPRIPIGPAQIIGGASGAWVTFAGGASNEHIESALHGLRIRTEAQQQEVG